MISISLRFVMHPISTISLVDSHVDYPDRHKFHQNYLVLTVYFNLSFLEDSRRQNKTTYLTITYAWKFFIDIVFAEHIFLCTYSPVTKEKLLCVNKSLQLRAIILQNDNFKKAFHRWINMWNVSEDIVVELTEFTKLVENNIFGQLCCVYNCNSYVDWKIVNFSGKEGRDKVSSWFRVIDNSFIRVKSGQSGDVSSDYAWVWAHTGVYITYSLEDKYPFQPSPPLSFPLLL